MPLLQCPGPAPDFATHAVVNGNIGHVALKDYQGECSISVISVLSVVLSLLTKYTKCTKVYLLKVSVVLKDYQGEKRYILIPESHPGPDLDKNK